MTETPLRFRRSYHGIVVVVVVIVVISCRLFRVLPQTLRLERTNDKDKDVLRATATRTTTLRKPFPSSSSTSTSTVTSTVTSTSTTASNASQSTSSSFLPLSYPCPVDDDSSKTGNDDNDDTNPNANEPAYYAAANAALRNNWPLFVATFHSPQSAFTYDGWGVNAATVRIGMYDWKVARWQEYLQQTEAAAINNDNNNASAQSLSLRIYESAGGIGVNLVMTADILLEMIQAQQTKQQQQQRNASWPQHIWLYGNEYMGQSTQLAHALYAANGVVRYKDYVHWGTYCTADSRQLQDFVPDNSFDVVLTGYITPLLNPLRQKHGNTKDDDNWLATTRSHVCPNATAVTEMQLIQEAWYDSWVRAMVRIAKPARFRNIWIEQVSLPLCQQDGQNDWGGVSRDFWTRYAAQWGVEESSIVLMDDSYLHPGRYHVAMRKT